MAKFHGKIGYSFNKEKINLIPSEDPEGEPIEEKTGIWIDEIVEREYSGDFIRESRQWNGLDKVNNDISLSNRISILADDFAFENFSTIRYASWRGVYWIVSSIEIQRPRMILTLGGVYNGPTYIAT